MLGVTVQGCEIIMPRSKPQPLEHYPSAWGDGCKKALEQPGIAIPLETRLSEKIMRNVRAKLIAMRNGFKKFEPRGTPLQLAAENQRLVFNKLRGDGDYDWTITVTYTGHIPRPSEQFERNWDDYQKGLRSSPF